MWQGAHAFGYNDQSLGVCLIGRDKFNPSQMITLGNLLDDWKIKYPRAEIVGHRDITNSKKTCQILIILWVKSRKIMKQRN